MSLPLPDSIDQWILEKGPERGVVVSSRARLARNLPEALFAPRANSENLQRIASRVRVAAENAAELGGFQRFELAELAPADRRFLRESHLISSEQEKGREHRDVHIHEDGRTSIMVNEEDHLRIQSLAGGFRLTEVLRRVEEIESALERVLPFAYDRRFGYLTACPTNTGTGLRVSVMLHLVGLVMAGAVDRALSPLAGDGLVVRGAYGENSTHAGDLFQISNEVTLGRTEEQLVQLLARHAGEVVRLERDARDELRARDPLRCEDAVQRALGVLGRARRIDSVEATTLLSHVRLGIGRLPGLRLSHEELDRMMLEVQPAHLLRRDPGAEATQDRDAARATYLRERFAEADATRG